MKTNFFQLEYSESELESSHFSIVPVVELRGSIRSYAKDVAGALFPILKFRFAKKSF